MGKYLELAKGALRGIEEGQGKAPSSHDGAPPSTQVGGVGPAAEPHIIRARIVSADTVARVAAAEVCFHCAGKGECGCAVGGVRDAKVQHVPGQCGACRGTGYLALSEDARCQ